MKPYRDCRNHVLTVLPLADQIGQSRDEGDEGGKEVRQRALQDAEPCLGECKVPRLRRFGGASFPVMLPQRALCIPVWGRVVRGIAVQQRRRLATVERSAPVQGLSQGKGSRRSLAGGRQDERGPPQTAVAKAAAAPMRRSRGIAGVCAGHGWPSAARQLESAHLRK